MTQSLEEATLTEPEFRDLFPEFEDSKAYPAKIIVARLKIINLRINGFRWRNLSDYGRGLMLAHYLALWKYTQLQNRVGADGKTQVSSVPGMAVGAVNSKSVGALSVGYDTSLSKLDDAGFWNLTTYGQEFWQLVGLIGMPGQQF
ncbi:DUF4054 domain-containing protein [Entomobacter blattae]|uniref:DUF4054 domain-containing protein n=1 Tax=Entomobacter blattae TaxID=2762277 RepID=A0A7H1NTZ4_9PROT|nr:DUF4054 domain-containing protein [Entomobacter blattae]QNT79254.1 hypothetical protein JGUZn3_20490 [Entomobacter blattae]